MEEVFKIAAAIFASIGGAGVIILGLAAWLGKVWSNSLMETDRAKWAKEIEAIKTELELARQSEHDLLIRQREVYQRLIESMRVFLSSTTPATEDQKREFTSAYDSSFLWASDETLTCLGKLLDLIREHTANPGSVDQSKMQEVHAEAIIALRRDSGFPETELPPDSYRIMKFQ